MGDKKELDLRTRAKIYQYILKNPGLHERELSRVLDIPLSTVDYHLYFLKKRELIVGRFDGHYNFYFASGKVGVKDKTFFKILRQKVTRNIIIFLLLEKAATHGCIKDEIGLAPSTVSFHLKKLVDLEILKSEIVGRETIYWVIEPDYISDLIISYKKSFLDDAVNRFAETWIELHPGHLKKKKK